MPNQMPESHSMTDQQRFNQLVNQRQISTSQNNQPSMNTGPQHQVDSFMGSQNKGVPGSEEQDEIMAYHSNEMGSSMSGKYSFLEDANNSSINYNFSFIGDTSTDTRINTPKEFNGNENSNKSKSQSDFEKLIESRNSEQFAKGIQRV